MDSTIKWEQIFKGTTLYRIQIGQTVATIEKRKKECFLCYLGKEYALGRKATFDSAEAVLKSILEG